MVAKLVAQSYLRASQERVHVGIESEIRPEPSLEEARQELASTLSALSQGFLTKQYGPLVSVISEQAINSSLKDFEELLKRSRSDLSLVCLELLDRLSNSYLNKKD
jgi:hypothetical protein